DVRDRAHGGAPRLHRRPAFPPHHALGAPMAGIAPAPAPGAETAEPAARIGSAAATLALRSLSIVLLLAFWEALARSGWVTPFHLPSRVRVVARLGIDIAPGEAVPNAATPLSRPFAGFAIAGIGGVLLGMLIFRNAVARWFFDPIISAGFPMPKVAFLP